MEEEDQVWGPGQPCHPVAEMLHGSSDQHFHDGGDAALARNWLTVLVNQLMLS